MSLENELAKNNELLEQNNELLKFMAERMTTLTVALSPNFEPVETPDGHAEDEFLLSSEDISNEVMLAKVKEAAEASPEVLKILTNLRKGFGVEDVPSIPQEKRQEFIVTVSEAIEEHNQKVAKADPIEIPDAVLMNHIQAVMTTDSAKGKVFAQGYLKSVGVTQVTAIPVRLRADFVAKASEFVASNNGTHEDMV